MADNKEVEDFLEHYGVLGMKWGVTKEPDTIARIGKLSIVRREPALSRLAGNAAKVAKANIGNSKATGRAILGAAKAQTALTTKAGQGLKRADDAYKGFKRSGNAAIGNVVKTAAQNQLSGARKAAVLGFSGGSSIAAAQARANSKLAEFAKRTGGSIFSNNAKAGSQVRSLAKETRNSMLKGWAKNGEHSGGLLGALTGAGAGIATSFIVRGGQSYIYKRLGLGGVFASQIVAGSAPFLSTVGGEFIGSRIGGAVQKSAQKSLRKN